ncbi:MAG: DUF362 domain-containing protein [Planctomycetota bacterium]
MLEADYMINMSILKRHDLNAAVTLCAKNHFGTIGNPDALHTYTRSWNWPMGTYDPRVDIAGHKDIGGKTVLFIIDGLYGADRYDAVPRKWHSAPFDNDWPSSVFVSQDGVAIDSVGTDFLRAEWQLRTFCGRSGNLGITLITTCTRQRWRIILPQGRFMIRKVMEYD